MNVKNVKMGLASLFLATSLMGASGAVTSAVQAPNLITTTQVVHAADTDGAGASNTASRQDLNGKIADAVNANKYEVSGGGTITGSQLVKDGDIIDSNYDKLTASGKQKLVQDMVQTSKNEVAKTEKKAEDGQTPGESAITDQTQQDWIQQLQSHPGVGTRMLTDILSTVKPDYNTARYILEPFAGPVNTIIAILVIVVMMGLTITFAIDLAYMYIPMFQAMADNGSGGGSGSGGGGSGSGESFSVGGLVSKDAKDAIQNESGKNPAMQYFKSRIVGTIILGLCILFLAQGKIFVIVGWILDLVSGVLHIS